MRILLDMDEVLCEWMQRILDWYNVDMSRLMKAKGEDWKDLTVQDVKTWDVVGTLGPESEVYIRNYCRWNNFYQELAPVPGAIEGVRELMKRGHDVVIATAIPKFAGTAYEGKLQWLRNNIPELPLSNLIAVKRKDLIIGDVLLDDGEHNLEAFENSGRFAVCMERPWNRNWKGFTVNSWDSFIDNLDYINFCVDKRNNS